MEYYRVCPVCGAHLDPGERCDCQDADELEGYLSEGGDDEQYGTARVKYLVTDEDLAPFAWERKENNLTVRVAAARELGVSYG